MKMTQFANFANNATKQILGSSGLIRENLQSMFSYPDAINVLNPVTVSGNLIYIEDGAPLKAKRAIVYIEPLQAGSGDPSPDNIRPISGWTMANVVRCGKNLFNKSLKNGETILDFLKTGQSYTFSAEKQTSSSAYLYIRDSVDGGETFTTLMRIINDNAINPRTLTPEEGHVYSLWSNSSYVNIINVQIEAGTVKTDYVPYVGMNYTITFTDEAGTVYGGTLDVTTGVLTVDRAIVDLGMLSWTTTSYSNRFRAVRPTNLLQPNAGNAVDALCSIYKAVVTPVSIGESSLSSGDFLVGRPGVNYIYVQDNRYSDVDAFKSGVTGVHLIYRTTSPTTYQLTPTDILMLNGINTVYADCGSIELEYYRREGGGNPYV